MLNTYTVDTVSIYSLLQSAKHFAGKTFHAILAAVYKYGFDMLKPMTWLAKLLYWPLKPLVQCKIVAAPQQVANANQPLFYITKVSSASDLATLMRVCRQLGLPAPDEEVQLGAVRLPRTLYLENPKTLSGHQRPTAALQLGQQLLQAHLNPEQNAQLVPVSINWGRAPGKEASVKAIIGEQAAPNWLQKMFIVLISGRHTLVQFSNPLSLQDMTTKYGTSRDTAHKLLRLARFQFYRQQLAATGPRQPDRGALFQPVFWRLHCCTGCAWRAKRVCAGWF